MYIYLKGDRDKNIIPVLIKDVDEKHIWYFIRITDQNRSPVSPTPISRVGAEPSALDALDYSREYIRPGYDAKWTDDGHKYNWVPEEDVIHVKAMDLTNEDFSYLLTEGR